jgi:hypothetical protein
VLGANAERKGATTMPTPDFETLSEELADEVSTRAAAVRCSQEEYREGLQTIRRGIISRIDMDIRASEETDQ